MFLYVLLDRTLSHRQIQTGQRVHVWVWIPECRKTRENYLKSWRLGAYYKSDAPVPRAQMGSDASLLPIAVNFFDSQFFSYCPFE